ncbi:helix-turn-helix transcriptional regulator [Taibaiella koreensis]|uniref:helix-turn-helix transcriptional regulator n=1 Tax=Taibaiella koreensis TaxID=1268548 RepID=UPI000E59A2C3|nr:LuxR C-terminal-related transcriptional regulator [Taibaiella koreensis]
MYAFLIRHKTLLLYGLCLAVLLFLLKWLEVRLLLVDHAFELYIGGIAVLFTALGIWLTRKLTRPRVETIVVEKEIYVQKEQSFQVNEQELDSLGISKRELAVLGLMAEGLSNQEIADRLFVSLNTVKTHSSNLFEKMEVKRRTQAVEKAKRMNIIP